MKKAASEASGSLWGAAETHFFYSLTPEHILSAIESIGVRCTGRCLALNSLENRVYDVEVDVAEDLRPSDPRRFRIAKFYRPGRWTREQILEEHGFLDRLKEIDLQVAAPLPFPDGATLGEMQGIFFAIFPKIPGRLLLHDELSDEHLGRLGRFIARMHNVGAGTPSSRRLALTPATYAAANAAFLLEQNFLPPDYRDRYEMLTEQIVRLIEPMFKEVKMQAIHGDFHLGNVLWSNDAPVVVDFDDMVRGPAVQDFWLLAPGRDDRTRSALAKITEAYEQMREFDSFTLQLIEPLRTLRMIHFTAWIARRWTDPAFPRAFPHFGTDRYWQEHVLDLQEQLGLMQEGTG